MCKHINKWLRGWRVGETHTDFFRFERMACARVFRLLLYSSTITMSNERVWESEWILYVAFDRHLPHILTSIECVQCTTLWRKNLLRLRRKEPHLQQQECFFGGFDLKHISWRNMYMKTSNIVWGQCKLLFFAESGSLPSPLLKQKYSFIFARTAKSRLWFAFPNSTHVAFDLTIQANGALFCCLFFHIIGFGCHVNQNVRSCSIG